MTQDQFLSLLTNWIKTNKQASNDLQISMDTELLGSGLLDSFDFLDLIVHIERQTGHKIDLAMADPNDFSVARGLWNLTVKADKPERADADHGNSLPANATIVS
jgi:acyl carrier protein